MERGTRSVTSSPSWEQAPKPEGGEAAASSTRDGGGLCAPPTLRPGRSDTCRPGPHSQDGQAGVWAEGLWVV